MDLILTGCVPAHSEAQWESEPGVWVSHPEKPSSLSLTLSNQTIMWEQMRVTERW